MEADRLEVLLAKLIEVEPKLAELTTALESLVRAEVARQLKERDRDAV
jgi:hypothetical protein